MSTEQDSINADEEAGFDKFVESIDDGQFSLDTPEAKAAAAPAETPAQDEAKKPDPAPTPEQPAADPYANLPKEVRELLAELPALRHEVMSTRGRVASIQSALDKSQASQRQAERADPPARARVEKLEAVRGELPEVAEAIEAALDARMQEREAPTPAPQQPAATQAKDPEIELLDAEHPGWVEKFTGTDFRLWLSRQPQQFQDTVMSTSRSGVVITALAKFEKANEAAAAASAASGSKRVDRIASAVTPKGGARPAMRAAPQTEEEGFNSVVNSFGR